MSFFSTVGSYLTSLVTKKGAEKPSLGGSKLLTLVRSFNWVVGHQKSLNRLAEVIHSLKEKRIGGIIVLAGEDQQGTKTAIVAGLAEAWAAHASAAFGELLADDYTEDDTAFVSATIKEWESSKVVRVRGVTDKAAVLHCLAKLSDPIREEGFLVIVEVNRSYEKPKSAIGLLRVDGFVSLKPQESTLEAALQQRWRAFAPLEAEMTSDEVVKGKHVLTTDASVGVIAHIMQLVLRGRLQAAGETPTAAKRARIEAPPSNTTIATITRASSSIASAPAATSHNHQETTDSHNTIVNHQALEPSAATGGPVPDWIGECFAQRVPEGIKSLQQQEKERKSQIRPPPKPLSAKVGSKVKEAVRGFGPHNLAACAVGLATVVWGEKTGKKVRMALKEGISARDEMKEQQAQRSKKRKAEEDEEAEIVAPIDNPPLPSAAELPPPLPPLPLPSSHAPSLALPAPSSSPPLSLTAPEPLIEEVDEVEEDEAPSPVPIIQEVEEDDAYDSDEEEEHDEDEERSAPAVASASMASLD